MVTQRKTELEPNALNQDIQHPKEKQQQQEKKNTIKGNRLKSKTNDWNSKIWTIALNRRSLQLTPWFTCLPSLMCCWWKHNYVTASWKGLNNGVTQKKKRSIVVLTRKKQPIPKRTASTLTRACRTDRLPPWKLPHSKIQFVTVFKMCVSNLSKVHPVLFFFFLFLFASSTSEIVYKTCTSFFHFLLYIPHQADRRCYEALLAGS